GELDQGHDSQGDLRRRGQSKKIFHGYSVSFVSGEVVVPCAASAATADAAEFSECLRLSKRPRFRSAPRVVATTTPAATTGSATAVEDWWDVAIATLSGAGSAGVICLLSLPQSSLLHALVGGAVLG
ncbi:hypothetical protein R6G99_11130, partial [Actinotignum timonense]|nr:hypothetical protein [Actinotignum timonense]